MTTLLLLVVGVAMIVLAFRLRQRRLRRRIVIVKLTAFIVIAIGVLYFVKYPPCSASIGFACQPAHSVPIENISRRPA
jgi:hypothetical protein